MDENALRRLCTEPPACAYAVAVPLIQKNDGWHLLYEVRAASLRRQAGEVCFPGGKRESEESAIACAVRELQEELGLSPERVIGALPFTMQIRGGTVCPVVMLLPDTAPIPNPDEVGDAFTVSVAYLQSHAPTYYDRNNFPHELVGTPKDYVWWSSYNTVPVYAGLPYPIWGLTARITESFLKMI